MLYLTHIVLPFQILFFPYISALLGFFVLSVRPFSFLFVAL